MAPKTIAIRTNGVDPVSPIRDDQVARAAAVRRSSSDNAQKSASGTQSRSNHGSGRSLTTRSTGNRTVRPSSDMGIMMDPAEHDAWRRLGGEPGPDPNVSAPVSVNAPFNNNNNAITSSATMATAEETLTTRSTSSGSTSSGSRKLRESVKQHERELAALKTKYDEAKSKMSKMKQEKSSNKKMLLEMSGLIKALQDISVDYEQSKGDSSGSTDGSKSSSSSGKNRHKAHLQNIQRKIQAIDTQMRAAKTQCGLLEEEKSLHTSTIKAQESQISALQDQINLLCQRLEQSSKSNSHDQAELQKIIQLQETQIWSLEGQISLLKRNAEERKINSIDQQNAARYQEISALEDKLAALREAQNAHKIQASALRTLSKSQDSQDKTAEESDDIEEDEDIPVEQEKASSPAQTKSKKPSFGKSARKKNKAVSFGNVSVGSNSLAAISEEGENSDCSGSLPGTSATSASETTGDTTTTSSDDSSASDSDDEAESSTNASSSVNDNTAASISQKERSVTVEPSEDGSSVEIMEAAAMTQPEDQPSAEDDSDERRSPLANTTKSTHSSRVDIMDDIKEEEEAEDIEDNASTVCEDLEQKGNESDLRKELEEAKVKYAALKEDYNRVLSKSNSTLEKLVLRTAQAIDSTSSVNELAKLKKENEELRRNVAKQEAMVSISNTKYENLRMEHTQTILELKGKAAQQEDLFSTDSNVSEEGVVDIETYNRLEKLHEAVVMKLADLGDDNDRLERERDVVKQQLENLYSQLQSHDESFFELQKLKEAYRLLEEERDVMQSKLDQMKDRNHVLKGSSDDTSRLRQDLADALARIEVLEKTNEEFGDVETKYTAAEVRLSILEGELEKANRKLKASKKKQTEREGQIREVIGQYKTLKGNYAQSQARVKRLEIIVESDKQIAASTTKKQGVSESARTERTTSSAEFSATKFAAMTAQLTAYENQINKLQKQRDAAMEQMKEMESELEKAKGESEAAAESKKSRERDLRIVLQHYEKLQKKYEATSKEFEEMTKKYQETVQKIDGLEEQIIENSANLAGTDGNQATNDKDVDLKDNASSDKASKENEASREMPSETATDDVEADADEDAGDDQGLYQKDNNDENSIDQLLDDMESLKRQDGGKPELSSKKRNEEADDINSVVEGLVSQSNNPSSNVEHTDLVNQLKEAKESSIWKNEKIARVLSELKASQDRVDALEHETSRLQSDLNILKGRLLIAQKESATSKERQESREVSLRDAIAKHHRLRQEYEVLESKYQEVQEKLEAAQKDSKVREEEAKETRKRASGVHAQLKRLKVDHSAVLDRLERLKQELEIYKATPEY